jgi:hypothetical protein
LFKYDQYVANIEQRGDILQQARLWSRHKFIACVLPRNQEPARQLPNRTPMPPFGTLENQRSKPGISEPEVRKTNPGFRPLTSLRTSLGRGTQRKKLTLIAFFITWRKDGMLASGRASADCRK